MFGVRYQILLSSHTFYDCFSFQIYNTNVPYDPEGLLGCLTSSVIVCLGVQAGITLLTFQDWTARVKRWIFWCVVVPVRFELFVMQSSKGYSL